MSSSYLSIRSYVPDQEMRPQSGIDMAKVNALATVRMSWVAYKSIGHLIGANMAFGGDIEARDRALDRAVDRDIMVARVAIEGYSSKLIAKSAT